MTRTKRYLSNVLWSWCGVFVTILVGFLLSPYIIHRVGDVNFSIWTLALSFVEYYWLMDLGFRSATIKMSAQFHATGEAEKLNELLSTGVVYALVTGLILLAGSLTAAPSIGRFFKVDQPIFVALVRMVGASFAVGITFTVLSSCLEGFQRFDLTTRVWLTLMMVRSLGIVILLRLGYGVLEMGYMLLASQLLSYGLTYWLFRRAIPGARLSWDRATWPMLYDMARYGVHTVTSTVANLLLNRSVPLLIAYLLPIRFLAYYTVPMRILEYTAEGVWRIGMVTAPNASELMAKGESAALVQLSIYANRYSFALFAPVAVFLKTYGFELFALWDRKDFASECAQILPVLLLGQFVMAGQQNSVSVLFGIGRHKTYARCLLAEAVLTAAGTAIALPRFGLVGAAWVISTLMALNRGAGACWLLARELKINPLRYAARIYAMPLGISLGTWMLLRWLKVNWIPGHTWGQLIMVGAILGTTYSLLAFRFCMAEHHRKQALELVKRALRSK